MSTADAIATVRQKYQFLSPIMDEKLRRRWAATEALALGWGGISAVAEATGLSLNTVRMGIAESRSTEVDPDDPANDPRIRRPGGGRKRLARQIVHSSPTGGPRQPRHPRRSQSPFRSTARARATAEALVDQGHQVSRRRSLGYSRRRYNLRINRSPGKGLPPVP